MLHSLAEPINHGSKIKPDLGCFFGLIYYVIQVLLSDIDNSSTSRYLWAVVDLSHDKTFRELPRICARRTVVVSSRFKPSLGAMVVHANSAQLIRTVLPLKLVRVRNLWRAAGVKNKQKDYRKTSKWLTSKKNWPFQGSNLGPSRY